ncbi:MAG: efflux RND transporter permease subunit [Acidobacteriota bacterium]
MAAREWIENHRRSILFAISLLVAGGAASLFRLPVSLFPRTTFPRIVVSADAGDRPADRMVVEVTRPLEEAVRTIPGVLTVRSTTSRGSCEIAATFRWGLDMISATLQVESAIGQALASLPPGLTYEVRRMDPTVFPVMGLSLTSSDHSQVELRDLALLELRPFLSTIAGVAKIRVLGGRDEEYQVMLDPLRLEAVGLTLAEAVRAVSAANVVQAVGRLEENERLYLILSDTQYHNPADVGRVILRQTPTGVILLDDVATIRDSVRPEWSRTVADGRDAVLVNIYQQPDGNTVRISREIRQHLSDFRAHLPAGVRMSVWYDQSDLIRSSAGSVRDAIIVGVVLAVFVLLFFLRNWKITVVVSLAVPAVLTATALLLFVLHMGLNIMTLGGMAAAVGLIIDDGIVMVEHILRRLRGQVAHDHRIISLAAEELLPALTGSSLATIVIFAPLAFLSGVTGAFFQALSLTMACSLAVSYLFAAAAVPVLSAAFLSAKDAAREDVGRFFGAVLAAYEYALRSLLARPVLLLIIIVPLLTLGWFGFRNVGTGFMPRMDEGGFILDYRAPAGTSLTETDRRLRLLDRVLSRIPEVASYSRRTGLQLGGSVTEANEGDYFIRLIPMPRRSIHQVMDDVRERARRNVPGLEIELAQLMEDLIGDLTAVPQPIEIKLFGPAGAPLRRQAEGVAKAISRISNVVDVRSGVVLAGDAVEIHVDRLKAQMLGMDPETVTRLAAVAFDGAVATQVQQGEKMVGVRVWTGNDARSGLERLRSFRIHVPDGRSVPLGRVARLSVVTGQPQIVREDLRTMVAVTGRISGRDMGSVIRDVKATISALNLPGQIYVRYGGLYAQQQKSFRGLLAVLGAAVALVFTLLLVMYERFSIPIAILIADLLAATGVFSGLWWTGSELNISSMMGLTMIVGISSEAGIFYMTQWQESSRELAFQEALLAAGRLRFRPIVMTTLAAILALLPLALGLGEGAAMLQPLAISIIAGLVLTAPLVLLVLPVLLVLLTGRYGRRFG